MSAQAAQLARQAVEIAPHCALGHFYLGKALLGTDKAAVEAALRRCLELEPDETTAIDAKKHLDFLRQLADRDQPFLAVIEPGGERRLVPISVSPFTIGRLVGCSLVVRDSRFNRLVVEIVFDDGRFYLESTGSRCDIFLNGERVPHEPGTRRELRPDDRISLGPDVLDLVFTHESDLNRI